MKFSVMGLRIPVPRLSGSCSSLAFSGSPVSDINTCSPTPQKNKAVSFYHLSQNSCSLLSLSGPSHRSYRVIFKPRKNHANLSTPVSDPVLSVSFGLTLHSDRVDLIPVTEATVRGQLAALSNESVVTVPGLWEILKLLSHTPVT